MCYLPDINTRGGMVHHPGWFLIFIRGGVLATYGWGGILETGGIFFIQISYGTFLDVAY